MTKKMPRPMMTTAQETADQPIAPGQEQTMQEKPPLDDDDEFSRVIEEYGIIAPTRVARAKQSVPMTDPPIAPGQDRFTCKGCGNEIDPDVCCCGGEIKKHVFGDGHTPVPMGCTCGYVKEPDPPLAPGQEQFEDWYVITLATCRVLNVARFEHWMRILRAYYHAEAWDRIVNHSPRPPELRRARECAESWRRRAEELSK